MTARIKKPRHEAIALASRAADLPAWLAARETGPTASEMHRIATGGKSTWRRILDDKLNGSTFTGNAHTRRGNEREPFILAAVADMAGVEHLEPNDTVWAHPEHPLHLATPDALCVYQGVPTGVEVKSRAHGYDAATVPAEGLAQSLWGMHVLGYDQWLFVTEVMGEDGQPTLDDPTVVLVKRDGRKINALVKKADEFIAWREAGAPYDDLPAEQLDVVKRWREASGRKAAAEAEVKALRPQVDAIIAAKEGADVDGWKFEHDEIGGFSYSVTPGVELDEEAWKAAEPESHAEWERMRAAVAETQETAAALYSRPTTSTSLRPVAPKAVAA